MPDAVAAIAALMLTVPANPNTDREPTPPIARSAEIHMIGSLGGNYTEARGVNDLGQVVGFSFDQQGRRRAFLWDASIGIVDLNEYLAPADAERWTLRSAEGINNAGQIVGAGWYADSNQTITAAFSLSLPHVMFCPADRTGSAGVPDGRVDIADLNNFLERYAIETSPGYSGPLTCDYVGPSSTQPDGRVTVHDLNFYIGLWINNQGPCP